jgi:hypothetical protein
LRLKILQTYRKPSIRDDASSSSSSADDESSVDDESSEDDDIISPHNLSKQIIGLVYEEKM